MSCCECRISSYCCSNVFEAKDITMDEIKGLPVAESPQKRAELGNLTCKIGTDRHRMKVLFVYSRLSLSFNTQSLI